MWVDLGGDAFAYRRRLWTVAMWCAAFVVPVWLSATSVMTPWLEPEPTALVREYLDAIRSGDVDRALTIAKRRPTGEEATFLTVDALDRGWDLGRVFLVEQTSSSATVEAEIITDHGTGATGRFELSKKEPDGDWHFDAPLLEVQFSSGPLDYLEVNGVVVASRPVEVGERPVYLLFPGVYRFYSDVPGLLDMDAESTPFLPSQENGFPTRLQVEPLSPRLAEEGEQRIQAEVNHYLDACVAKMRDKAEAGCPFGVAWTLDPRREDGSHLMKFSDVEWRIEKYPIIAATYGTGTLVITHREEGVARFTANGIDDGERVPVATDRPIRADRLAATISPGGEIRIIAPLIDDDPLQWADWLAPQRLS